MTPLTPLDTFRKIIGYNPWHFWQLSDPTYVPVNSNCNDVVYEYNWQNVQAVGRDAVREALERAEEKLGDYLGYDIAPKYHDDLVPWRKYYDKRLSRVWNGDPRGQFISVQLPRGQVQAIGVESLTLIGNANVARTDADGDGLAESFSVTIATTETDPLKIAAYFTSTDRLDSEPVGDRWRVQPVSVTISGGNAVIRGKSWLVVRPILYEGVDVSDTGNNIDPTVAANFATQLAVYVRTTNPNGETVSTSQAVLEWETEPAHGWWCCCGCQSSSSLTGGYTDPASYAQAVARAGIRDAELGVVIPDAAVRNATTGVWSSLSWNTCREPDRARVRYLAGVALDANGQMNARWAKIVARLAAAELAERLCACDIANKELYRWQFDLARSAGANDESYQMSESDLDNPFGTARGHVQAWREVRNLRRVLGITTN